MINNLKHISLCSLIFLTNVNAQQLRFTQIRVGIDPIFSATMFIPQQDLHKYTADYHNWEGSLELIGPYRLSFIGEFGHTNIAMNVLGGTEIFRSKGYYGRLGCNFDLSKPNKNYELDLGWRLGLSIPQESAYIYLKGQYWNSEITSDFPQRTNVYLWAEMLLEYKFMIIPKHPFLRNFWLASSFRIKLNPSALQEQPYKTQYVPGLGFGTLFAPSFAFNLIYAIHFSKGQVHKSHHLHNNFDILEDKNHHLKEIKRHKEGADDIDRD
jgi:hypothetical protein